MEVIFPVLVFLCSEEPCYQFPTWSSRGKWCRYQHIYVLTYCLHSTFFHKWWQAKNIAVQLAFFYLIIHIERSFHISIQGKTYYIFWLDCGLTSSLLGI